MPQTVSLPPSPENNPVIELSSAIGPLPSELPIKSYSFSIENVISGETRMKAFLSAPQKPKSMFIESVIHTIVSGSEANYSYLIYFLEVDAKAVTLLIEIILFVSSEILLVLKNTPVNMYSLLSRFIGVIGALTRNNYCDILNFVCFCFFILA